MNKRNINEVTLLITHFNRSSSLKRLLSALRKYEIHFNRVIVADGGSNDEHLSVVYALETEFNFFLITSPQNLGLGNTINIGQDAVETDYILYVQEDFTPKEKFGDVVIDGLELMKKEQNWDLVRFFSFPWSPFPYLTDYKNGFSTMKFSLAPWYTSHLKFHVYSDHPHLKRKSFPDKFGRYKETRNSDNTEMSMCRSFLKNDGQALYYRNYKDLFEHENSDDEPGLFRPEKEKTKKFSDNRFLYSIYLKYKTLKDTISYILNT